MNDIAINQHELFNGTLASSSQLNPIFQSEMTWMVYVYVGCEILVAIGAVFGNTLVITAFRRERRLRRRTNYYIVSLAVADFLVGLLGIPCALLAYYGYPKQLHACLFTVSLLVVLCTISIFSLVAVSVDRYWAILFPMGYSRNVRTKTAIGIICFCWVAGAIVGFLPLLGWNAGQSGQELEECRFTKVMNYNFLVFIYFATIIFPGLLMALFYAHIYSVVVKQLKQMVTVNGTSGGSGAMLRVLGAARKREVKATQNLSIIVLFFMLCWFPLYTINFIQAFNKNISIPPFLMDSCIILTHLNSAGNPLLYAYHLRDFRAALRAVLFGEANTETDRRVIGRDNSAYLHDLEQRRRSSQLNLYGKSVATKDQNLNLTHLPVINCNKLSDIQETSKNESTIKIPTVEISKTTSFFKFPLDRSLSRLKDREKITNFANNNEKKRDFTYNHFEESNASVGNEGSVTRGEDIVINGGVVNNGFLKKDEGGEEENLEKRVEYTSDKEENTPKTKTTDENCDCSEKVDESFSKKSCTTNMGEKKEGDNNEESCDDADYGDDDTEDDDDTNVRTGKEITTGIFNDCYIADDDSVDEIDNSILSNDRSLVKNDCESCLEFSNLDNTGPTEVDGEICGSDLKRVDSESDQVGISYRKLEKIDSEVGIPYCKLKKVGSEVDIPYCELKRNDSEFDTSQCNFKRLDSEFDTSQCSLKRLDSEFDTSQCNLERFDSEVGIPYNKFSSNDLEEMDNTYNDLNISDEACENIGITCSNLNDDEDQICDNLDGKNSGKSSQQSIKYTNLDNQNVGKLEGADLSIQYKNLNQRKSNDSREEMNDCLKTKSEKNIEGTSRDVYKNVEKSKNNLETFCTIDSTQNLEKSSDKHTTTQVKVEQISSSSPIKSEGNKIFEESVENSGESRTISQTSDRTLSCNSKVEDL